MSLTSVSSSRQRATEPGPSEQVLDLARDRVGVRPDHHLDHRARPHDAVGTRPAQAVLVDQGGVVEGVRSRVMQASISRMLALPPSPARICSAWLMAALNHRSGEGWSRTASRDRRGPDERLRGVRTGGRPAGWPRGRAPRQPALGVLQRLGRSLMLPIAALPVAALLLRLGPAGHARRRRLRARAGVPLALARAGRRTCPLRPPEAPCSPTSGLLFAVGVAVGFARRSDGSTALAAVVGYLVFDAVTEAHVAVRPRRRRRRHLGADRLRGVRRHPDRPRHRAAVAALPPDAAADLPRLLRRPSLRADPHRQRGAGARGRALLRLPRLRRRAQPARRVVRRATT